MVVSPILTGRPITIKVVFLKLILSKKLVYVNPIYTHVKLNFLVTIYNSGH